MKRLVMAMTAMAGLAGCAPTPQQSATRPQIDAAGEMFLVCAGRAAKKLDVPTESAMVVAQGVEAECARSWGEYVNTVSQGMSPYEDIVYLRAVARNGAEDKQAVMMVLRERRGEGVPD